MRRRVALAERNDAVAAGRAVLFGDPQPEGLGEGSHGGALVAGVVQKPQQRERTKRENMLSQIGKGDVVVTIGQDGLVANVAKYVGAQPLVPVNPDPERFDGQLLPFGVAQARAAVARVLDGTARRRPVTLAEVRLDDGQRLLAFNDLFIGARSHVSARYAIGTGGDAALEAQSSSGVIVSTGAGSTGWLSSVFNMAAAVAAFTGGTAGTPPTLAWDDPRLVYVVREPFVSKHSRAGVVAGLIAPGASLTIRSQMPTDGVIFSDGVEADALAFGSGAVAHIGAAAQRTQLVVA